MICLLELFASFYVKRPWRRVFVCSRCVRAPTVLKSHHAVHVTCILGHDDRFIVHTTRATWAGRRHSSLPNKIHTRISRLCPVSSAGRPAVQFHHRPSEASPQRLVAFQRRQTSTTLPPLHRDRRQKCNRQSTASQNSVAKSDHVVADDDWCCQRRTVFQLLQLLRHIAEADHRRRWQESRCRRPVFGHDGHLQPAAAAGLLMRRLQATVLRSCCCHRTMADRAAVAGGDAGRRLRT